MPPLGTHVLTMYDPVHHFCVLADGCVAVPELTMRVLQIQVYCSVARLHQGAIDGPP